MSALEVLRTCLSQRKALLSAIGGVDPTDSNLITFDLENHVPHLLHQLDFLIQVVIKGKTIHHSVIDEGASTCIMSLSCWKVIGCPPLNQSPNKLEAFNGRGSHPYGILNDFPIQWEGKTINVEVEVVDANLNYNLLLGRSWTHAMFCVVSTLFHGIYFPHQGKIVIFNHLAFFSSNSSNGNVPYVGNTDIPNESVGVGIFIDSSLMGNFPLPPLNVAFINMVSNRHNPWVIPHPDQIDNFGDVMLVSPVEQAYQAIILILQLLLKFTIILV